MAANLQSIFGDRLKLPSDFVPDDSKVVYTDTGAALEDFDDPENEFLADSKAYNRYVELALAYYNGKNNTDYKLIETCRDKFVFHVHSDGESKWVHCGFAAAPSAAPSTAVGCESSIKTFASQLHVNQEGEQVINCLMLDGIKTTGCKDCDCLLDQSDHREWYMKYYGRGPEEVERELVLRNREDDLPLSDYVHYVADGVTLSELARFRLPFPLLALAYYNKKHHKDYKLVDALPNCLSIEDHYVLHCNFIARQNAPADDVSNQLFFVELERRGDNRWFVTACRTLHGCKTMAGCHICVGVKGKRVIHPTQGFRFGRCAPEYRRLRRRYR